MTDRDTKDEAALEALFESARSTPPEVPQALMAQVLADAVAHQPAPRPPERWFLRWMSVLGGAPGMGGLIAASCLGFWIGIAAPGGLPDVGGTLLGTAAVATEDLSLAAVYDGGWVSGVEEGWDDE